MVHNNWTRSSTLRAIKFPLYIIHQSRAWLTTPIATRNYNRFHLVPMQAVLGHGCVKKSIAIFWQISIGFERERRGSFVIPTSTTQTPPFHQLCPNNPWPLGDWLTGWLGCKMTNRSRKVAKISFCLSPKRSSLFNPKSMERDWLDGSVLCFYIMPFLRLRKVKMSRWRKAITIFFIF